MNNPLKIILNKIIKINIFYLFILFSCNKDEVPKTYCTENSKKYIAYKPVFKFIEGKGEVLVWGRCGSENDFSKLGDHLFVSARFKSETEVEKGCHPNDDGENNYIEATNTISDFVNVGLFRGKNLQTFRYPAMGLKGVSQYGVFTEEADKKSCPDTYECLSKDQVLVGQFNSCDAPPTMGIEKACPTISTQFNTEDFLYLGAYNNFQDCKYPANNIFPALKADVFSNYCSADYYYDNSLNEIGERRDEGNRFIFVNIEIKAPLMLQNDYAVELEDPNVTDLTLKSKLTVYLSEGNNNEKIRYCGNTFGHRRFVLRFKISGPGNYKLNLYDRTEGQVPKLIETCPFKVSSFDQYSEYKTENGVIDINNLSQKRQLGLIPLNLPGLVNASLNSTDLKVSSRGNLEETLIDAFSLNLKLVNFLPQNPSIIKKGITFSNSTPCNTVNRYFDNNGNIKILKSKVREFLPPGAGLNQVSAAYEKAIQYTYRKILNDYYEGCKSLPDYKDGIIFIANGGVLVNDDWSLCNPADPTGSLPNEPFIGNPNNNFFLLKDAKGLTGPNQEVVKLKNLMVAGVFKVGHKSLSQSLSSVPINNLCAITLVHEIGHLWGHGIMTFVNATNTNSDTDMHNHLCTGYNKDLCVFRYHGSSAETASAYRNHDKLGVIWCESHQQIFLNQLQRKVETRR